MADKDFDREVDNFLAGIKKLVQVNHYTSGEGSNPFLFAFIVYEE